MNLVTLHQEDLTLHPISKHKCMSLNKKTIYNVPNQFKTLKCSSPKKENVTSPRLTNYEILFPINNRKSFQQKSFR